MNTVDAAQSLIARGFRVVPIPRGAKGPVVAAWNKLEITSEQAASTFALDCNIGVILGEPSRWLVDVDLDCGEACVLARKYLPPTAAVSGRGAKPDSHWWYICEGATPKRFTDRVTGQLIAEIRSNGQQTVVGPSKHPTGDVYDFFPTGEPAEVSFEVVRACVTALSDAVSNLRHGEASPRADRSQPAAVEYRIPETSVTQRAIAYLSTMPGSISGSGGHSAAYAAATSLVHGFGLSEDESLGLLLTHFNPRCVPAWSEKDLARKCSEAAKRSHDQPRGWLLNASPPIRVVSEDTSGVDISRIMEAIDSAQKQDGNDTKLQSHLLRIPGFISDVMDLTMSTAPYPNLALAFAGALSLQALIAGRKVRDDSDCRTNLYTLALADSGSGKEWPRKVNFKILSEANMLDMVGDRVASGESLQDAMNTQPAMLLQTDEIDEMFSNMKQGAESRYASFQKIIMTMWSSAGSVIPMRLKSGGIKGKLDQPHLVLMGSAVPEHFFSSLSESMLTSGLVSRLLIVEAGPRGRGNDAKIITPPASIMETVKYWRDLSPGGDLASVNPEPILVPYTEGGKKRITEAREYFDNTYDETKGPAMAVWSRACEQAKRLALIYAISEDPIHPSISEEAVNWSCEFADSHAKRLIEMSQKNVHDDSTWHRLMMKCKTKLIESGGMNHSQLLRAMRTSGKQFREIVDTLIASGEIVASDRNGAFYEVAK